MNLLQVATGLLVVTGMSAALEEVTTFIVDSDYSALKVVLPTPLKTLSGSDGIKHSQALFGAPSYGGDKMIAGELFYVTPGDQLTGCDDFHEKVPDKVPAGTHMIFLVDRGSCDFVQKMRTAQKLGAVAVVIADNLCQCSDMENSTVWSDTSRTGRTLAQKQRCIALTDKAHAEGRLLATDTCERGLPYMADDGTGADVRIPSFLIDYLDAQPLKDCMASAAGQSGSLLTGTQFICPSGSKVVVSLEWDLPRKNNKVDWQLWSSSDSEGVFKKSFALTAKKLKDQTSFTPQYFLWDGEKWGCTIDEICGSQCTEGGLYCNPDPDHNLFYGVSGRDVVEENLREICIWDQAVAANNSGLWWDYVVAFADACHPGPQAVPEKFNKACSEAVQGRIAGLSVAKTNQCSTGSWTGKTNSKLDAELNKRAMLKILQLPTAVVNGVLLRGGVTPLVILSSICAGFAPDKAPTLCSCVDRVNSDNLLECINSECGPSEKLCAKDKKCYSKETYPIYCSELCSRPTEKYCQTLSQCLPENQVCPNCPDAAKPAYCPLLDKCVESFLSCTVPPSNGDGTSASGVFVITMIVVSMAGCGAYVFWRRQKARLHEDVRAILSSYMALEENDEGGPARPSRQVQPTSTSGPGAASSSAVSQDAASYI
jgi:hypothetical protein